MYHLDSFNFRLNLPLWIISTFLSFSFRFCLTVCEFLKFHIENGFMQTHKTCAFFTFLLSVLCPKSLTSCLKRVGYKVQLWLNRFSHKRNNKLEALGPPTLTTGPYWSQKQVWMAEAHNRATTARDGPHSVSAFRSDAQWAWVRVQQTEDSTRLNRARKRRSDCQKHAVSSVQWRSWIGWEKRRWAFEVPGRP